MTPTCSTGLRNSWVETLWLSVTSFNSAHVQRSDRLLALKEVKSSSFPLQMSDQDSSTSASQTEGELEEEMDEEMDGAVQGDGENDERHGDSSAPSLSSFSSSLRAVIRIKQKYQAMKKRRQELALALGGEGSLAGAPVRTSPKIFTFDPLGPSTYPALSSSAPQRKRRRRRKRVLFPNSRRHRAPPKQEHSRAKYCLYLLFAIVFIQVKFPDSRREPGLQVVVDVVGCGIPTHPGVHITAAIHRSYRHHSLKVIFCNM